jgi:hypothetical protein
VTDATLFSLPVDAVEVTSDDCYTSRWVFDAMGLRFDLDVAATPAGPHNVPAERWYTATDDGLAQPWSGTVWCNPPYSDFGDWARHWSEHPTGALMGMAASRQWWRSLVFGNADAVWFGRVEFERPGGRKLALWQASFIAFRGVGTEPAERLAAADPYGAVLYGANLVSRS